ncbi:MAG: hypothetical protein ABIK86_05680 [candidate division WOR-3 bacterium]
MMHRAVLFATIVVLFVLMPLEAAEPALEANRSRSVCQLLRQRLTPWYHVWSGEAAGSVRTRLGRPACLAGRFGDAFMVDTGLVLGPAQGSQHSYGAASNGEGWLVMWNDTRDYSMRTARVGPDCSLRDTNGVIIGHSQSYTTGITRALAGTGPGFIAVWVGGDPWMGDVWAARLDSAGRLIDSFPVHEADFRQQQAALAFDGDSVCLVVWSADAGEYLSNIYAARVTTSGRVLDPIPFPVAQQPDLDESGPAVAYGNGVFLVAWHQFDTVNYEAHVKAIRVSRSGTLLDTAFFLCHDPGMMQAYPALAFGDTCFLATWAEGWDEPDVYAARVTASGRILDPEGVRLSSTTNYDLFPSAAFDGNRYLVAWTELDWTSNRVELRARRMTTAGVPLDSGLIRVSVGGRMCFFPSVAADRVNYLVGFDTEDTLTGDGDVCCARISFAGVVLDTGLLLPLGGQEQFGPRGTFDGENFLAVWLESSKDGYRVEGARVRPDRTVPDPTGFAICDAAGYKYSLAVGAADSLMLVAWADQRDGEDDIYCARVTRDGRSLDLDGIVICDELGYEGTPGVGSDGSNFLVVWQDYRNGWDYDIYAARIRPDGTVLDPDGFAVTADTNNATNPAVSFTGSNYLVVWEEQNQTTWEMDIYGALVSPTGTITRPRFPVSVGNGDRRMPTVARGLDNLLVAWQDSRISGGSDIYATRMAAGSPGPATTKRCRGWCSATATSFCSGDARARTRRSLPALKWTRQATSCVGSNLGTCRQ